MTRILFDRILFATDFSPASTVALPYATAIARHFGAKLYLAYVIPPDAYDLIPVDERDPALKNMRTHAEEQMAGMRATPLLKGLSHEVLVDHGVVWPMLSAMAEQQRHQFVCDRYSRSTRCRKDAAGIDFRGDPAVRATSGVNGWTREFGSPGDRGPTEAHSLRDGFLAGVRACDALRVRFSQGI